MLCWHFDRKKNTPCDHVEPCACGCGGGGGDAFVFYMERITFATTTIMLKRKKFTSHCIRADVENQARAHKHRQTECCMEFAINVPVFHFNDRSCRGFTINSGFIRCCGSNDSLYTAYECMQHCLCVDLCFTCDLRSPPLPPSLSLRALLSIMS